MTSPEPTTEQYAAVQAAITAAVVAYVLSFAKYFAAPVLTAAQWVNFLSLLFPEVARGREEAARSARDFYDAERARFEPDLPPNARLLERYEFDWFVEAMEPLRVRMQAENTPERVVAQLALRAAREVENAGRRQIIGAVEADTQLQEVIEAENQLQEVFEADPEFQEVVDKRQQLIDRLNALKKSPAPNADIRRVLEADLAVFEAKYRSSEPVGSVTDLQSRIDKKRDKRDRVRAWARVATGAETCAWCLMLVSRGPVYMGADTAGAKGEYTDLELAELYKADEKSYLAEMGKRDPVTGKRYNMDDWHDGCDCLVVPVFDKKNWAGFDAWKRAEDLWATATEKARAELEANPDKKYYSFKGPRPGQPPGWYPTNLNRETINQLRKMIDEGEISSREWAALAAA